VTGRPRSASVRGGEPVSGGWVWVWPSRSAGGGLGSVLARRAGFVHPVPRHTLAGVMAGLDHLSAAPAYLPGGVGSVIFVGSRAAFAEDVWLGHLKRELHPWFAGLRATGVQEPSMLLVRRIP
jgi:hypothetical protein